MKTELMHLSILSAVLIAVIFISNTNQAWATSLENVHGKTILASDVIKNNPLAMKILQNIELSKEKINQQVQQQLDIQQAKNLLDEKSKLAKDYLHIATVQLNKANSQQLPIDLKIQNSNVVSKVKPSLHTTQSTTQITTQNKPNSQNTVSDNLKNDPIAQKILKNIEISKQRLVQYQKDKKNLELIAQQRNIAKSLQGQALQTLQLQTEVNSSKNSFDRFVSTVENNNTKKVFVGQYDLMKNKVDAGHIAMKKTLDNGGTYENAILEFSKYAAVKHVEMIKTNKDLNVQYGGADAIVQTAFNEKGVLPNDYIKLPTQVLIH